MTMTTTFEPQPFPIAIGGALDALGFRLVLDEQGGHHLYWPPNKFPHSETVLPGALSQQQPAGDCERSRAMKALVQIVREMSSADMETMFAAFAEFETVHGFDFRELLSA